MSSLVDQAWEAARLNNVEKLKSLVPSQVSPDAKKISENNHCHSLLMCAAAHGSVECAQYLLESKADPNLKNFAGFTALHWAAFTNQLACVDVLLQFGADLEERTADGKTPFHIAAFRGYRAFLEYIMRKGADINAIDSNGWNAIHYTIISKNQATAEWLVKNKVHINFVDAKKVSLLEFAKNNGNWFAECFIHSNQSMM